MAGDRPRYGLLVSALGAIVLAVSVFLPWYGVSFTAGGIAAVEQVGDQFAAQFGDAALRATAGRPRADLGGARGPAVHVAQRPRGARSDLNVILLVLAGLAILDALFPLARAAFSSAFPTAQRGSARAARRVAAVCVLFRIVDPPTPAGDVIALSLREGAWLALLGSLAMIAGGLWPRRGPRRRPPTPRSRLLVGLSGWSPGAADRGRAA